MTEIEIKRVNFFDGQFLKEGELNDLNDYAVHMHRRLLFVLFDQDGVVQGGQSDLAVDAPNPAQKVIRVRAGMAIAKQADQLEAQPIILREDIPSINLTTQSPMVPQPLQANDTGIVTIRYDEENSGGAPPTRIKEKAAVVVYRNNLPPVDASRPLIVLGSVAFNTMAVTLGQRQTARINASLTGAGAPAQQQLHIDSIVPQQAIQGAQNVTLTINGAKLGGATAVSFDNPGIAVQNFQADPTGGQITAAVNIAAGAALGASGFTVTTPGGAVASGHVKVTVLPIPQVTAILPTIAAAGQTITLRGVDIRDTQLAANQPAATTTVALLNPNTQAVLAQGTGVTALADIGIVQQIKFTIPAAAAWTPQPAANSSVNVKVRVTFNGASGVSAGTLQVNF